MNTEKQLFLIGLGMGSGDLLTARAKHALEGAEIVFGAARILESAKKVLEESGSEGEKQTTVRFESLYKAEEIASCLKENPQLASVAVVFSGDTGFFSGAVQFFDKENIFEGWEIQAESGISSAVYFASKLHKSWQKWKLLSLHGATCNTIEQIRKNPACFFILSGAEDLRTVGKKLETALKNDILSSIKCYLGSNLSYDVEKIRQISPKEMENFAESEHPALFVLLVENEHARFASETPFLKDEDFIRREKIPMTKQEVRELSVCALRLSKYSVVYDIGSGSGSVTVEAARIATEGQVFAIECNEDALSLTRENVEKFCLENVSLMRGFAPECLENADFPPPTHVFIGGSKGNLAEIVQFALKKNPAVRIVANFVSLENLCEMQNLLKSLEEESSSGSDCGTPKISDVEIRQIAVTRAEKAGDFHLMKAQNPVWVVSFSGNGEKG